MMGEYKMSAVEALADAWASIDLSSAKWAEYVRERDAAREGKLIGLDDPTESGRHLGYLADAESMIERLERRGYVLSPR